MRLATMCLAFSVLSSGCVGNEQTTGSQQQAIPTQAGPTGPTADCVDGNCKADDPGTGTPGGNPTTPVDTPDMAIAACDPVIDGNGASVGPMPAHDATSRGQLCLDCHDGQPHANLPSQPPKFDIGGRLVDKATGLPEGNKLVLIQPDSGAPVALVTNQAGYFWWPPNCAGIAAGQYYGGPCADPNGIPPVTFPAKVAVSDDLSAVLPGSIPGFPGLVLPPGGNFGGLGGLGKLGPTTTTVFRKMCLKATSGSCASCHDGSVTAQIF